MLQNNNISAAGWTALPSMTGGSLRHLAQKLRTKSMIPFPALPNQFAPCNCHQAARDNDLKHLGASDHCCRLSEASSEVAGNAFPSSGNAETVRARAKRRRFDSVTRPQEVVSSTRNDRQWHSPFAKKQNGGAHKEIQGWSADTLSVACVGGSSSVCLPDCGR